MLWPQGADPGRSCESLPGARHVRQRERKSEGAKQARGVRLNEQRQPGNHVPLQLKYVNRVRGPWRVGAGA